MRLHVQLILVLLAVHARAATIASPDLEKKLPEIPEPSKDVKPIDNVSSELELIDSANTIKDVENNLRVKAADIPVKVVIEDAKADKETSPDFKRVEIDLNNPGEPQRQEHETQNPVHFEEEQQIVFAVKQTVLDTEANLKQDFQSVAAGIQNWISNNEQLSAIQQSIQSLQQSFANQFSKLNETIQSFWNNQNSANSAPQVQPQQIESLENHLKALENNFDSGVKALSEGVEVFATLKQDNPTPQAPAPPNNLFVQYIQMFQSNLAAGFQNITQAFQNYVNQTTSGASGGLLQGLNSSFQNIFNPQQATQTVAQSDEATTSRPTLWQGIQSSIQNILNPGQNQPNDAQGTATGTPNRPIAQAIQNLPFVQGVVNLIQPTRPEALPQPVKPADIAPVEGTNAVPATPAKPDPQPPKANEAQPAVVENAPIKNIVQNNPIVKGISGAVQKLQSLSNPEKPRDVVETPKDAEVDAKGHGNTGDTSISGSSGVDTKTDLKTVTVEGVIPEQPTSEVEAKPTAEIEKTEKS